MREKELRLALVCYGGISLAVYMHGITKEVWHLVRASRGVADGTPPATPLEAAWRQAFQAILTGAGLRIRVLSDIIAGASAGGINGIFLGQAIASGQSLEPLTDLWLNNADADTLLAPDARPVSAASKFWATPIAWLAAGKKGGAIEQTVSEEGREEVRAKLSRFVRARWFEPPFGGEGFCTLLLEAFDAMARRPAGPPLLPVDQPLDLFVTVTDFAGYAELLKLNSPPEIQETEHRLTLRFSSAGGKAANLADTPELVFAARATASFPGAFPPFTVGELDRVLKARGQVWPNRDAFLARALPGHGGKPEHAILIDGSVLANAPFGPAIDALKDRPARREVDRRFVYIDPKPGERAISLSRKGETEVPGFFTTIFSALSDIPREQPIRDNLEAIEGRSARIRRQQRIVEAIRPDVERAIEALFGLTFFIDKPTPARIGAWREKAHQRAGRDSNFFYSSYAHLKLSGVVEEIAALAIRLSPDAEHDLRRRDNLRQAIWAEARANNYDQVSPGPGKGASTQTAGFFRQFDAGFRIRRMRFVLRALTRLEAEETLDRQSADALRNALHHALAPFLALESVNHYAGIDPAKPARDFLDEIARRRNLQALDTETDASLAEALAPCPKEPRRALLFAYLGFPFFDIATLPLLQGEGLVEFDPIKVDRISPEDPTMVRKGVKETLKGIELNSFGAFFSRTYRENDYLWGRLHGADRLFDILMSSASLDAGEAASIKKQILLAILDEEEERLKNVASLFAEIRREIEASAKPA